MKNKLRLVKGMIVIMEVISPLLMAFTLVFLSELGDKTQLIVLSFSSKLKTFTILIGVAIGSLLSHGIAILFGSFLGNTENVLFHTVLELITYISFIVLGIIPLIRKSTENASTTKNNKISNLKIGYVLMIALSIAIGEFGDKTFLASIGLGINYPYAKVALIIGAILGMVVSDLIAIIFGKLLSQKIPEKMIEKISAYIFIIFGVIGLMGFLIEI